MNDITSRLRDRSYAHKARDPLCEEAADEIDRLRLAIRRLADQDATLSVCDGNVTVEVDETCPYVVGTVTRYCSLTPLMLTDEEREAIERGMCALNGVQDMSVECSRWDAEAAAVLRALLERTAAKLSESAKP